ncbi:MAG: RNA polymerase sigma factor, partial [Sphingobacterium sp.]
MSNDVDLLKKIVHKDKDAFETIYKAYFRKLYTLSFRYVRNEAIAEELTNDVFMMLWENAGKLAINQSLGAYLSRSVINLSLTHLKKNQRLLDRNNDYIKNLDLTDDEDQTDFAALYESKLLMIESILESLPPQCR